MAPSERERRLRWLCRRGMKELDVLFERFLDRHGGALAEGEWPGLERLLAHEDDVLWDALQDPSLATVAEHADLLRLIRGERAADD